MELKRGKTCTKHVRKPHRMKKNVYPLTYTFVFLFFFFQQNKQILIDAVVHAVNEDYVEMANDFTRLGFLASGTDVAPIIPALEAIWQNSSGKGLSDFNFRSVTGAFHILLLFMFYFMVYSFRVLI